MLSQGRLYNRQADIHGRFGGQQQGGISTPNDQPYIFLFTGSSGDAYGYSDGPAEDGMFHYFGEGQRGDMEFVRGTKAVLDHSHDSKSLLLFQTLGKGKPVRYLGEYGLADWTYQVAPDVDGSERRAIVFKLVPIDAGSSDFVHEPVTEGKTLQKLRAEALAASSFSQTPSNSKTGRTYYERSKAVRDYVLVRAGGTCESCEKKAPFSRKDGSPYLEPHHLRRVSDGGPDHPAWVAAVCPNCHREIHHGSDGEMRNEALKDKIRVIEHELTRQ